MGRLADKASRTRSINQKADWYSNRKSRFGWASGNWSGYTLTGPKGNFNSIAGKWQVPQVHPSRFATYSSTWIGIDGFDNNHLIQTGTEQDFFNGRPHYYAWWEILPYAERRISALTVSPGDVMYAEIRKLRARQWVITIRNVSTGDQFVTIQSYSGPQTSAEWIQEAPLVNGKIGRLAHYGATVFDRTSVNHYNPQLLAMNGGIMIGRQGRAISTPSNPDRDRDGFAVRYGAGIPPTPDS